MLIAKTRILVLRYIMLLRWGLMESSNFSSMEVLITALRTDSVKPLSKSLKVFILEMSSFILNKWIKLKIIMEEHFQMVI
jgi:hypothetical protein